jgi:hypothetical protein
MSIGPLVHVPLPVTGMTGTVPWNFGAAQTPIAVNSNTPVRTNAIVKRTDRFILVSPYIMTIFMKRDNLDYNDWKVTSFTDYLRIGNPIVGGEFMRSILVGNKEWKILMLIRSDY